MKFIHKYIKKPSFEPSAILLSSFLVALLYVFMEWTYNYNNAPLSNSRSFLVKTLYLVNSAAILALSCSLLIGLLCIPYHLLRSEKVRVVLRILCALVPSFLITLMLFLLIDNITYTLWKTGIVSSTGLGRGAYTFGFVLLLLLILPWMLRWTNCIDRDLKKRSSRERTGILAGLFLAICICAIFPVALKPIKQIKPKNTAASVEAVNRPNILLITVDSLNASYMSLYGYTKETTPFLEKLAASSIIGENHFSNAQGTIGSITSILTGKYPADTRVLSSDDVLKDEDAYEHLPGILKQNGYTTVQLAFSYYADANNLNLQDGFDLANDEKASDGFFSSALARVFPTGYFSFLRKLFIRGEERLFHIFFIRDMSNPYKQMTEAPEKFNDAYKMNTALTMLESSKDPMFIHIHWLGTHGPKYYPETQVFSKGMDPKTQGDRVDAFYLDSILEFDTSMANLYKSLDEQGLLDNTVIIITADHSQLWTISRLPLIMYFPGGSKIGSIESDTENLDIAPTILDYLKIPQPGWMPGQSLLSIKDPDRPIFINQITTSSKDPLTGKVVYPPAVAPFYQFGKFTVVECDTWYMLNVQTMEIINGKVRPYEGSCTTTINNKSALNLIMGYMHTYGFDTSSLASMEDIKWSRLLLGVWLICC